MTDPDPTPTEGETLDMPERMGAFAPGRVLGERYQIREMLGRGGMGEVWHAIDVKLRVEVALKALRPEFFKSERRLLGLRRGSRFEVGPQPASWIRFQHTWRGFTWKCDNARWLLRNYGGLSRRMVLFRNGQPLAAIQYRGRQMHARPRHADDWSEPVPPRGSR